MITRLIFLSLEKPDKIWSLSEGRIRIGWKMLFKGEGPSVGYGYDLDMEKKWVCL